MQVILDTNVFVSGVFFSGPPYNLLDAWRREKIELVVSPEILQEYRRVGERLSETYPGVSLEPLLELVAARARLSESSQLPEQVCSDPDDDKFLACALASRTRIIVSGDKALLKASGYRGLRVVTPREFVERYL